MKILIPSKGRAENLKTVKYFGNDRCVVFIQADQEEEYRKHNPDTTFVVHNEPTGVQHVRNVIMKYAEDNNLEKFFVMDDDVKQIGYFNEHRYPKFEGRKTHTYGYTTIENGEEVDDFIESTSKLLDTYAGVFIPMSGFARLAVSDPNDLVFVNRFSLFTVYALNLEAVRGLRFDPVLKIGEDHDFTLQVLLRGHDICANYGYAQYSDHKVPGGCFEDWNTFKRQDIVQHLFDKWDPKFFIVPKEEKNYIRLNFKNILKHRQNDSTN